MFIDKESHLPGRATKTVKIKFTKEILRYSAANGDDCPIFHAMRLAGLPVRFVGGWNWTDQGGDTHKLSLALTDALDVLLSTSNVGVLYLWRRFRLQGKEFEVAL